MCTNARNKHIIANMSAHFYFVPEEEAKIEIKKKQEFMLVGGSSGSVGIN